MNYNRRNMPATSRRFLLIAGALVANQCFCSTVAHARDSKIRPVQGVLETSISGNELRKGTTEIALAGSIGITPGDIYNVTATAGPFLTKQFQIAGTLDFNKVGGLTTIGFGAEGNFHIPVSNEISPTYFYAGGFAGVDRASGGGNTANSTTVGAQVGFEHFLTPYIAATVGVDYRHPTQKKNGLRDTTQLMFGLATFVQPGTPRPGATIADFATLLPHKGTNEVGLSGMIGLQPSDIYNISGTFGPFLNDQLQIAGTITYNKVGGFTNTIYGLEGNVHFPSASALLPYVGVFIGGDHASGGGENADSTAVGGQAGFKYFLNPNIAATAAVNFRHPTKTGPALKDRTSLDFGLSIFLK